MRFANALLNWKQGTIDTAIQGVSTLLLPNQGVRRFNWCGSMGANEEGTLVVSRGGWLRCCDLDSYRTSVRTK